MTESSSVMSSGRNDTSPYESSSSPMAPLRARNRGSALSVTRCMSSCVSASRKLSRSSASPRALRMSIFVSTLTCGSWSWSIAERHIRAPERNFVPSLTNCESTTYTPAIA
eukprot:Amastigsp_a340816_186.p2 type:complete len:111 gc:universal Amastigsp_a340816_186:511-843(+)